MLEIRNLSHAYPDGTQALSDLSLTVPAGLFGLLGPNGAGKSTLMRILATLQRPSGGGVRFAGFDVLAEPMRLRRTLGYLPQDFGVYPHATVADMLDHLALLKGIAGRGERRELVDALLDQVHLRPERRRPLASLSGGMRQRFGIAQALIGQPRLIVVDEPTAGLDPQERFRCLDLLAGVGDGVAVILSTHIVSDVADLCPQMAVLAGGRLRFQGAPATAVDALAGRVWRKAVGRDELPAIRATHRLLSSRLVAGRTVVHLLADASPGPGFEEVEPTLEDAYFAILANAGRAG